MFESCTAGGMKLDPLSVGRSIIKKCVYTRNWWRHPHRTPIV